MSSIITRSQWGAKYRDGFGTRALPCRTLHQHHSVTTARGSNSTLAQDIASVRQLEAIGHTRFGGGISYPWVITQSGRIFQGLSANRIGAHTAGYNTTGTAICYVGNYQNNTITAKQRVATIWLMRYLRDKKILRLAAPYWPHSRTSSTVCPGSNVRPLMASMYDAAKKSPAPPPPPPPPAPEEPTVKPSNRDFSAKSGLYNYTLFHANREFTSGINDFLRGTMSDEDALALARAARNRQKAYRSIQVPQGSHTRLDEAFSLVVTIARGGDIGEKYKARFDELKRELTDIVNALP